MDGAGAASQDILGIEIGRTVVRGVLLDEETAEISGAAECAVIGVVDDDGSEIMEPATVAPSVDDLLYQLGIEDRVGLRVGLSIGPKNAGVGSGSSLQAWLEHQSQALRQPLIAAGDLGVAFAPEKAVDAAVAAASEAGLSLSRVDLAPVAAARVLGDEVEDAISIGSGRGWRARLRDFEVLEAMECGEIADDDPLRVIRRDGLAGPISRYSWVEIAPELRRRLHLDLGQLAPSVGAAIGVAYGSPANLLTGRAVAGMGSNGGVNGGHNARAGTRTVHGQGSGSVEARADRSKRTTPAGRLSNPEYFGSGLRRNEPESTIKLARIRSESFEGGNRNGHDGEARSESDAGQRQRAGARTSGSDPIDMFSPDTDLSHELDRPDGRLDLLLGFLVVLAVALLIVYLFL